MSKILDSFINSEMVLGKNIKPGYIFYFDDSFWLWQNRLPSSFTPIPILADDKQFWYNTICAKVKKVYVTAYSGGFVDVVLNFHEDLMPIKINGDTLYKAKKSSNE